jgi:hypothetical protein
MAKHLWHWDWHGIPGRPDATGHGPTLESVMADFRRASDNDGTQGVPVSELPR